MTSEYSASRKAKLVGAIQWAFVGYSISQAILGAVTDYYFHIRGGFSIGPPSPFDTLLYLSIPVSIACGLVVGYSRVDNGTASPEQEKRDQRKRVAFVVVLLLLGFVSLAAEAAASALLGEQFYTVPYFLLPSVFALLELPVSYYVVYVSDVDLTDPSAGGVSTEDGYRPSRLAGIVGGSQWAVTALFAGFLVFGLVGFYLSRTRETYSLSPVWQLFGGVAIAFVAGYFWARREVDSEFVAEQAHRQRLDYVVALIVSGIALSLLLGVGMMVVASIGASISYFTLYTFVTFGLSILLAYALVYVAEIELLGRVLST